MVIASRGSWAREPHTVVLDDVDSPTSVSDPFAIVVESAFVSVPLEFEPHAHPLHELVWMRGGTMTVRLANQMITVPEGHGLWLPANVVHSGRTTARSSLFNALFDPDRSPVAFTEVTPVEVTPVIAALLTHLENTDLSQSARLRAEAVVFDVLEPSDLQLALPVPHAERIGPIVDALVADPADDRTLSVWAAEVGSSERTVTRLFRAHTGLSFLQWRQALRVHHALTLIGEGLPVQEISEQLGYSQASTFIASFKRVMGTTPGTYAPK
jgi:AraC-like DNA-binding protein